MMEMEVELANKVQGKAEDAEYSAADEQRMPALKEECIATYKEKVRVRLPSNPLYSEYAACYGTLTTH